MKARNNRDRVVIATKVGMGRDAGKENLSRSYIAECVEASLKRLQTDHIDLYQSHQDDPGRSVDEPLQAYAELMKAGKIRFVGASNFSADRLAEALAASERGDLPRYESIQPEYNLYTRQPFEGEMQKLCLEKGLGAIPYFSLAAGFLTGKYRSEADFNKSPRGGGMAKIPQPARTPHSRRARRRRAAARGRAGPGRPGVADGAARRYGTYRQRHLGRTIEELGPGSRNDTLAGGSRGTRPGQRRSGMMV